MALPALAELLTNAMRFSTLEATCEALNCQPGDILTFVSKD